MPDPVVHLSAIAGAPLLDREGGRLGRVQDVVVRLAEGVPSPAVSGLVAKIGGREMFVPVERVATLEQQAVRTATTKLDLAQFERRPGEVLLVADVLDRSLINVRTANLITARDLELVREDGTWRIAGVEHDLGTRFRRLLPRSMRAHQDAHDRFVPWSDLEAFVGHVPSSRLKLGSRRLGRLHPAQIADLVEAASHAEGEEILAAVSQDKELEADVFEELDDEHQGEFLNERSDEQVAAVLARMAPDDVADLLLQIQQERRLPILNLLPADKQRKVMGLLGHNPATAGGLMNPDFISVPMQATVEAALQRVRESSLSLQQIATVCVVDDDGCLVDAVSLAELVRADPDHALSTLTDTQLPAVPADADLPEVARLMADYNLVAMPVLDASGAPVGIIAVDDVLEQLIPEEWRRRAGVARS